MCVDHEPHQPVPDEERKEPAEAEGGPERPVWCEQAAAPGDGGDQGRLRQQDEGAVEDMPAPLPARLRRDGQEVLLPPHLDQIIGEGAQRAAIEPIDPAPQQRSAPVFVGRHRLPHIVPTLEIGEAVVDLVVSQYPKAHCMGAGQEGQSPDPSVEDAAARQGLVTGIMADDEDRPGEETGPDRREEAEGQGKRRNRDQDAADVHSEVGAEKRQTKSIPPLAGLGHDRIPAQGRIGRAHCPAGRWSGHGGAGIDVRRHVQRAGGSRESKTRSFMN